MDKSKLRKIVSFTVILASTPFFLGCDQEQAKTSPNSVDWMADHKAVINVSRGLVPKPPWPAGDEIGMANTLGVGTSMRCAFHLSQQNSHIYELSHLRSNEMPSSYWTPAMKYEYPSTAGLPNTLIAWHSGMKITGVSGAQGTQMDAFGHWGYLDEVWDGKTAYPLEKVKYYGGHKQLDVKPIANGPLQKLGIDNVPPIITSAVLLDAKTHLGQGKPMKPGQQIHGKDIEDMLVAQGLGWRDLLPGDVLYIYTGWGDNWQEKDYYDGGPGLSFDAAKYLETKSIVLVGLDNPYTDAINVGQFSGQASPPPGTPREMHAPVHHHNLTHSGIHQIQNIKLAKMANEKVWTSCTVILPIKVKGASGAPVSPIAIGVRGG